MWCVLVLVSLYPVLALFVKPVRAIVIVSARLMLATLTTASAAAMVAYALFINVVGVVTTNCFGGWWGYLAIGILGTIAGLAVFPICMKNLTKVMG